MQTASFNLGVSGLFIISSLVVIINLITYCGIKYRLKMGNVRFSNFIQSEFEWGIYVITIITDIWSVETLLRIL